MAEPVIPDVRIFENLNEISNAAAAYVINLIEETLAKQEWFTFVLAGGNTPKPLYELLASEQAKRLPWEKVQFFWGDERYLPPTNDESNVKMARETLLQYLDIPVHHAHPMPTSFEDPEDAAQNYEELLEQFFQDAVPRFDLVLLGLGGDGHTASLFPGSGLLQEKERWVGVETESPKPPPTRLTLTYPALNAAKHVSFLASGKSKAKAVGKILGRSATPEKYPAAGVQPQNGDLIWWLDKAAAKRLK